MSDIELRTAHYRVLTMLAACGGDWLAYNRAEKALHAARLIHVRGDYWATLTMEGRVALANAREASQGPDECAECGRRYTATRRQRLAICAWCAS